MSITSHIGRIPLGTQVLPNHGPRGLSTFTRLYNGLLHRNTKKHFYTTSSMHNQLSNCEHRGYSHVLCGKFKPFHNIQSSKALKQEVRAFSQLLQRSNVTSASLLRDIIQDTHLNYSTSSPDGNRNEERNENDKDDPKNEDEARMRQIAFFTVAAILMLLTLRPKDDAVDPNKYVSWNEFLHEMLAKGEVEEIAVLEHNGTAIISLHHDAVVKGRKVSRDKYSKPYYLLKLGGEYNKFEEKVRKVESDLGIRLEDGVPIRFRPDYSKEARDTLLLIMTIALFFLLRRTIKSASASFMNPTKMFGPKMEFKRGDHMKTNISFKDIAGLHEAKTEVMEFVDYLKNQQKYKTLGARIPKGALLLGPPGCGKTLLAKAVASEAQVPFIVMAGTDFVEMVGGVGASRVRDLFKEARHKAPCIIYIDEIDAIGRQRSSAGAQFGGGEEEQTLNQLLVEMDGMGTTQGVIMLASTNRADVLDKALLRAGRFDRHILIDHPTLAERREIFEMYLMKLKTVKQARNYVERLAQLSPGMSGADIANICNESALHAARHKALAIDTKDFEYAVERVVAGVAKKSTVLSPQEKKILAYHEAGHALVGWMLEHTDALLRVSIVPRTSKQLGFSQYMPQDKHLYSKEELFEKMCMALGGRVAESLTFNSVTHGAQDDLSKVTKLAYQQVRVLGMNSRVGLISFPEVDSGEAMVKPYSKSLGATMDDEARQLVAKAYQATEAILSKHKDKLRVVSESLLEKEALTYDEVETLIGPPPFGKKKIISLEWDK